MENDTEMMWFFGWFYVRVVRTLVFSTQCFLLLLTLLSGILSIVLCPRIHNVSCTDFISLILAERLMNGTNSNKNLLSFVFEASPIQRNPDDVVLRSNRRNLVSQSVGNVDAKFIKYFILCPLTRLLPF